ncbi:MAG: KH domain-containing protein [Candidatus Nomurabacteria bacterium]|jgi:predicted RNA-binding protein YlqC (UPF0109 family)|nr:KH domain-containing protein [Candidatus Nomurabacteria bacterium]
MATIDEQFIEYIVKQLVNDPDAVKIERVVDEKGVLLSLTVSPEDIGRVIGKRGATAQSLRNLLRALGSKNDARYNLKIVDVDRPEGERPAAAETAPIAETEAEVEETTPETIENVETVEEFTPEGGENSSELAEKTRKELADLDDLDI